MVDGRANYLDKRGLPPGSLVHVGPSRTHQVILSLIDFDNDNLTECKLANASEASICLHSPTVSWLNVSGIHDKEVMARLGDVFNIHPLILEDIMNASHRPKVEDLGEQVFFTLKMLRMDDLKHILSEQVSMILGPGYVISFQEDEADIFDPIRQRIRNNTGLVRSRGADFLVYRLMDLVVDNYFVVLEEVEARVAHLELVILHSPETDLLPEIQALKRDMLDLRRDILPLRDAVGSLEKGLSKLVDKRTARYFRDVQDHIINLTESIEHQREVLKGLTDIHLTNINNRLGEVMKVLTVISTIFIPLTFIVGVYGMNFDFMPELRWKYGYAAIWAIMLAILGGMVYYFKRKKWF